MKTGVTFIILFFLSNVAISGQETFAFGKQRLNKEDYKYHKCIENIFAAKSLKAKLTYQEICKYGKQGCPKLHKKEKSSAFCGYENLSQCFENKDWISFHQLMEIPENIKPGLVTYGMKKGSPTENKTCAYWN